MAKKLKIMTVCGFGIGSSLILKMNVDDVLEKVGIEAETFSNDVTSVGDGMADLIFTSNEIGDQIIERVSCEVIVVNNFMDKTEIEEKGIPVIKKLMG